GHDGSYRGTMEDFFRIFCMLFKSSSCHDDKSSWYDGIDLLQIFFNLTAFSSCHARIHRGYDGCAALLHFCLFLLLFSLFLLLGQVTSLFQLLFIKIIEYLLKDREVKPVLGFSADSDQHFHP
ncbi:hypothetical protein A2U01_0033127, partial [Trifolium medium]|nr:hypothetical protein [Trifolium medium]